MLLIKNIVCADGSGIADHMAILINDGKIEKVLPMEEVHALKGIEACMDGGGQYLTPGYIDLHVHGAQGHSFSEGPAEIIDGIAAYFASRGVTSLLVGTGCNPPEKLQEVMASTAISAGRRAGANILGVHMEGPFINPARAGACYVPGMLPPDVGRYEEIVGRHTGLIRLVTLAPELDEGLRLTRYLAQQGVCVSIGHSVAPAETVKRSIDAGVSHCTHFFNGMKPLHHRDPGIIGIALQDDRIHVELIGDLIHLDADILRLAVKVKGVERCILISDNTCAGQPDGVYGDTTIQGGVCRNREGVLSGSTVTMDQNVRNLVHAVGLSLPEAIRIASENPAKEIGFGASKGKLQAGYDADLNFLDKDLHVTKTIIMGKVFQGPYPSVC